ncbi:MAG: glycosyltransferase family 4 protein [Mobilitalea sp.]
MVLFGSAPEDFLLHRLKYNKEGITLRYSERLYKRGLWRAFSPRGILRSLNSYHRFHGRKLFMLCASAYTSGDLLLHGEYPGRCYRWGYFPVLKEHDIDTLLNNKPSERLKLIWCGRLIKWKHPEAAVDLAYRLKSHGIEFDLELIGTGELEEELKRSIERLKLTSQVTLSGALEPEKVRNAMEAANIFLSTSDFEEGWGAVLNEAMNSGCVVFASHAVGAAPYLIKDSINGFIYENGRVDELFEKVGQVIKDPVLQKKVGRQAYQTIYTEWNAQVAAERLLYLLEDLKESGSSKRYFNGPCSKAKVIQNQWYQRK